MQEAQKQDDKTEGPSLSEQLSSTKRDLKAAEKEVSRLKTEVANLRASLESGRAKREDLDRRIRAIKEEAEEKLKGARKVATVLKEALKKVEAQDVAIPIALAKSLVKLDQDIEKLAVIENK